MNRRDIESHLVSSASASDVRSVGGRAMELSHPYYLVADGDNTDAGRVRCSITGTDPEGLTEGTCPALATEIP